MSKILIVEDEEKLRKELKLFLENNGYEVITIDSFSDTINDVLSKEADLILLDISLPNINGEVICKEVRKTSSVPIIMVTSKNTDVDEIISINYGADDFITKPYNLQVLLARIEMILRRVNNKSSNITYKDIIIDTSKSCIIKNNKMIELSKNEFRIFYYLVSNKGKIVPRDELMDYLWENNEFIDDNTLTVNINRLRAKLEDIGYSNIILTKRGLGYIIL